MAWHDEFGSAFFLTVLTACLGFASLIVRAALKSNCKNFNCCCGLFRCVRDTTVNAEDLELGVETNRT